MAAAASSFRQYGVVNALLRCLGIVIATTLCSFIPMVGLIPALVVWFAGIMFLFEKSLGQTFVLFIVNVVFSLVVAIGLGFLLASLA